MLTPNLNTTWMFHFFYWNELPMWMHLKSILWELIRLWSLKSISRQLNIFQAATFTFLSKVSIAFALMWIFSYIIGVALFEFKCWVDIAVESVDFDANYYFQRIHCSIDIKHCLLIKVLQQQQKLVNMNETNRKKIRWHNEMLASLKYLAVLERLKARTSCALL